MRRIVVALAAALLPARMHGQGASSMHPIDFDGDGDIDIVKSSPIGIVWLENHGVDKEWETHIISLNQNIKDAVAAHKRHRKFVDVMEGRGVGARDLALLEAEPRELLALPPDRRRRPVHVVARRERLFHAAAPRADARGFSRHHGGGEAILGAYYLYSTCQ